MNTAIRRDYAYRCHLARFPRLRRFVGCVRRMTWGERLFLLYFALVPVLLAVVTIAGYALRAARMAAP